MPGHALGFQFATTQFDPGDAGDAGGDLFGLTIAPGGQGVRFVDDANNSLQLLR